MFKTLSCLSFKQCEAARHSHLSVICFVKERKRIIKHLIPCQSRYSLNENRTQHSVIYFPFIHRFCSSEEPNYTPYRKNVNAFSGIFGEFVMSLSDKVLFLPNAAPPPTIPSSPPPDRCLCRICCLKLRGLRRHLYQTVSNVSTLCYEWLLFSS